MLATPYATPQDPTNYLGNDYGRSDLNLTNRLVIDFAWDPPGATPPNCFPAGP